LNAGVGRPLDLAQAEAQVASTRVQMEQARGDEANARTLLAFLIGAKEVSGPLVDEYAVAANPPNVDETSFQRLEQPRDYKAAKAVVEASVYNVNAPSANIILRSRSISPAIFSAKISPTRANGTRCCRSTCRFFQRA